MLSLLDYLGNRWDDLLEHAWGHVQLVGTSVLLASLIGVGLGVVSYRSPTVRTIALTSTGLILVIPSLALFGFFQVLFGLGMTPAVAGLTLYGLLPIVRNTVVGLNGVDAAIVESAAGMGMSKWQRLLRVELPLAWPVIVTGIRVSALILVAIAAIAAIVNAPGLGEPLLSALARAGSPVAEPQALAATLSIVLFGILVDVGFRFLVRATTPKGIR